MLGVTGIGQGLSDERARPNGEVHRERLQGICEKTAVRDIRGHRGSLRNKRRRRDREGVVPLRKERFFS
jgi:hypothetical protein